MKHETLTIFSEEWAVLTMLSFFAIFMVLVFALHLGEKGKRILRISLGISYLAAALLIHPYLAWLGKWSLQYSLPLHLCTLSGIIAGVAMLWPKQITFELLLYWGLPGGFHSILTPEFTDGREGLLVFDYYFVHINIMLAPLLLMLVFGLRPGKNSWLRIFLLTQLALPVIGFINWLLHSNYMFLAEKPIADNPFIIGDWPWYILVLEVVMLVHFYLVYFLCTKATRMAGFRKKLTIG